MVSSIALVIVEGNAMRPGLRVTLIVCSVGLLALAARADDRSAFLKMLADPAEQQRVMATAQHSTVVLKNPCAAAHFTITSKISVEKPATFDSSGGIVAGAWRQIVTEEGCGTTRILNVFLFVQSPRQVGAVPMLPGTTHADLQLQRDAGRYVQIGAHLPEANCGTTYVADTAFIKQAAVALPGAKALPWEESWTIITCTRRLEVPIHFIPDATGTTISVGPSTAIKETPLDRKEP
jgi:hypothetical protein